MSRSAVTVIYDEAPRFVPQGGAGVDEDGTRCRVAVTEVVMLGRRKGLGSILISQRPSKLHKDVLEQADMLIAHRLMGNNDRKAVSGWLEEYGEDASSWLNRLPKLSTGEAVVLAPEYDLGGVFQIRMKSTFDSSATPEVGAVLLDAPRGRALIDLGALEAKLGHALEQAQENDPEALRRRIRKLEGQLAEGAGADVERLRRDLDENEADRQEAERRAQAAEDELDAAQAVVARLTQRLAAIARELRAEDLTDVERAPGSPGGPGLPDPAAQGSPAPAPSRPQPSVPRPRPVTPAAISNNAVPVGTGDGADPAPVAGGTTTLKAGAVRMLDVLAR